MPATPTPDRKAAVLLMLLIAGAIDMIGLAETGRYFVSFMSGDATLAALAVAGREPLVALLPLGLVALFVAGASIGTLVAERAGRWALAALLLVEAAVLALAWAGFGAARPMLGVVPLPVAMGIANVALRDAGGAAPGVASVTGALAGVGAGLAALGRGMTPRVLLFRLALVLALFLGAVAAAIARLRFGADALLVPVATLAAMALLEAATVRRLRA